MARIELSKDFWSVGATLLIPARKVMGGHLSSNGDGWINRFYLTREEAGVLAERLAELGFGPKSPEPEKPKGIGELSELEYLRSLVLEMGRRK